MNNADIKLSSLPADTTNRKLWLQNAAGLILFRNVREYAIEQLDESMTEEAYNAAKVAIDSTIYGLLMLADGVLPSLKDNLYEVDLRLVVQLSKVNDDTEELLENLDLRDGDGACIGFHGWVDGDFGDVLPVDQRDGN